MLLNREDAWLRAYFFSREHHKVAATNAQAQALDFADKLLAEFDQRFQAMPGLTLGSGNLVDQDVSDAMSSFAGMIPPGMEGAVRGRLENLAKDVAGGDANNDD